MTSTPAVTVVIPTRDRPAWLGRAVRLALAQRDTDVRVVVVDDHSRDAAAVVAAAGEDPRVHVIRQQPPSHGVAAARNTGLATVTTPYVAFLDDDDVWHPEWLRAATAALSAQHAELVFGPVALLDAAGWPRGWEPRTDPAQVREGMVRDNVVGVPSQVVASTAVVRSAGGWDTRFSALADWALWLQLRDARCAAVDDVLVGYTVHPMAMHLHDPQSMLEEFRLLREVTALESLDELRFKRWLAAECARFGDRGHASRLYLDLGMDEHRPGDFAQAARLAVPVRSGLRRRFSRISRSPWWPAAEALSAIARESLEPSEIPRA